MSTHEPESTPIGREEQAEGWSHACGDQMPQSLRLELQSAGIAGLDYGNPTAPPMVLLHGIRDLAWSMHAIAIRFRDRYRVLAFDLRGHGDSDKPGAYGLPYYIADLRNAIRHLGLEKPILVGHSLGGQVVAQYSALFPELPRAAVLVEGLGPPMREGESTREGRRSFARYHIETLAELSQEQRSMLDLDEAAERFLAKHPRLTAERARFLVERGTCPHPSGGLRWKWDPRIQGTWSSVTREQNEERWGWIECPVLLVTAGRSGDFWRHRRGFPSTDYPRKELERRLACFRNGVHVEVPGAGHMIHFDEPDALVDAMNEFLDGLSDP